MGGRIPFGVLFLAAGVLHLVKPGIYLKIVPPVLPYPLALVYVSGVAEMLGGLGVILPGTRRAAAWGLILLLLAVWPANFYMAMVPERFPGVPHWALWGRLPLQIPLIWWAWLYARTAKCSCLSQAQALPNGRLRELQRPGAVSTPTGQSKPEA